LYSLAWKYQSIERSILLKIEKSEKSENQKKRILEIWTEG
jgi:hypothetical protein